MVRLSRILLKDGISKTLSEMLVCPLSKQPLRFCEESNSLISDAISVSFPIVNGIPCLVPKDGKVMESENITKPEADTGSPDQKSTPSSFTRPRRGQRIDSLSPKKPTNGNILDISEVGSDDSVSRPSEYVDGDLCCVCLSRLKECDKRVLPCFHEFHIACIDRWFIVHRKTCPVCRFSVEYEEKPRKEVFTEEMVIWFSSFHFAGF